MRAFWLLGVLLFVLLSFGMYELIAWNGFHLARMEVRGVEVVARKDVVHRAGIDPKWNLWLQNMRAVDARIEEIPYVETAYTHRSFPASAWVTIVERKPDGCVVRNDGVRFTIDAHDRILEMGCKRMAQPIYEVAELRGAEYPGAFLRSARLARVQQDAHALSAMQPGAFVSFALDAFDQLEATMQTGMIVRFGDDVNLEPKVRLLHPILATLANRLGTVAALDVRAPSAPVVEYKPRDSYRTDAVSRKTRHVVRVGER